MDILLIGSTSSFMRFMVDKLNKEGHRIFHLTKEKNTSHGYRKVFETYRFNYDNECIGEVFQSVKPDVVIFMGAYDLNFGWVKSRNESVAYTSGLMNIIMSFSALNKGRFIYLSSEEVFQKSYPSPIDESEQRVVLDRKGQAVAMGEEICLNYRDLLGIDAVVLRLDHMYAIPEDRREMNNLCAKMCMDAIDIKEISINKDVEHSFLYVSDAVEFVYKIVAAETHRQNIYHISSMEPVTEQWIAGLIQKQIGSDVSIVEDSAVERYSVNLSAAAFNEEFGIKIFHKPDSVILKMAPYLKKHESEFSRVTGKPKNFWEELKKGNRKFLAVMAPFLENMVAFIPFFMMNNRAVGSQYFANLDFYLLYVLLFAIVYGQQQAIFSSLLAVSGYIFRQMYQRSGFEVILDYNTYVWIAQLLILGLVVGYMRDQLKTVQEEEQYEIGYLTNQLDDISDINVSNVRVKEMLSDQVINQNDSLGKIYEITSSLDRDEPEEILFHAAEVLSELTSSEDVAVYRVANRSYARLFSSTSDKARGLGNSINYQKMEEMYEKIQKEEVYINRNMNKEYPLMANAIYSDREMQLIIMIWGIPWEKMTLGQANMLTIAGYLIQNAVVRANRYMSALEEQRYVHGTKILEEGAFTALVSAYLGARNKNLTECALLSVEAITEMSEAEISDKLNHMMRQSDYLGRLKDGKLYALLANTDSASAEIVKKRFLEAGFSSEIREEVVA